MAFPQIFSNFFGVVVPGREANTNFVQVDETRFVTDIIAPQQISEIAFFLLPECPISEDCGVVLFYCVGDSWRYLGSLTQFNPSEIFPTGWPMNEDLLGVEMIQLGVSIESNEFIQNLESGKIDSRKTFAEGIALDLYRFMESFSQVSDTGEVLVVPTDVLDKWFSRFNEKFQRDPNFMMKRT